MYLALYRKYRPRTFDDVISQEHITTTLKNQVANNTAAHAYLFTGSRGTGKTTCAKIMAMAVNCLNPQNGNPCLECERCKEILSGEATDIVEMDAASNNGVDDVRQLRDEVAYTPVSCKYRVYIIDEVHMLSPAAFNALLKTLEEPPPHVKFILATTELHKVPATISSRCQRFEFRRVDIEESTKRLLEVADKENVALDKDAAELISRLSDGGMRDALSILDRCASADDHITPQVVRDCAGVADNKHLFAFSDMVAKKDVAGCIRLLGELHKNSKDLALVIDELLTHYRDLMLYKTAPNDTDLLSALPENYDDVARTANLYDLEKILRCLTLLQQCADNIGKTKQRKTLAEMCLVKMCTGVETGGGEYSPKVSPQAAKPAHPVIQIQEPPRDDFVPKSYEEMSERERATAKRTQQLLEQTTELLSETKKEQPSQPPVNEPPVEEPPAFAEPEPPEVSAPEPPWEQLEPPEQGFLSNDYPINSDEPPVETTSAPPVEAALEVNGEKSAENAQSVKDVSGAEDIPSEISAEQWQTAVSKMDIMSAALFDGSTAKLHDGVLEVFSSNELLTENAKGEELEKFEKAVTDRLGFPIKLKITAAKPNSDAEENQSKLNILLSKARQLGIEIQEK